LLYLIRTSQLHCAVVFPVEVEPVVGLEDLVRKLGEAQAAIGIGLVDGQSRLDAISRQQFVHPKKKFQFYVQMGKTFFNEI